MRRALLLLLLVGGAAHAEPLPELPRLALSPIFGEVNPSACKSGPCAASAFRTSGSITLTGSTRCVVFAGGKICSNGTGQFDLYGGTVIQLSLTAGTTYLGNSTTARGTVTFDANVASGSNAVALSVNGQRIDVGTGANDYWYGDGTGILTPAAVTITGGTTASNFLVATGILYPRGDTVTDDNATTLTFNDAVADGASAVAFKANSTVTLSTSGAHLWEWRNNSTLKGSVDLNGIVSNSGTLAGTAGSGTGITTVATAELRHHVHKITVARTALTAAATTQDVTIWTIPAKTRVLRMVEDVTQAFDDAAGPISAVTTTCGTSAGGNQYLLSGSVFATATLGDVAAEIGAGLLSATVADIPSFSATTAVQCRWTSTGGNLSTLTTGSSTFYLEEVTYP